MSPNFQNVIPAERAVLMSACADNGLVDRSGLLPDDFLDFRVRECWRAAMEGLSSAGRFDEITLIDLASMDGVAEWLQTQARQPYSFALSDEYAALVASESKRRRAYAIAQAAIEALSSPDHGDAVDLAIRDMLALSRSTTASECGVKQALRLALEEIDDAAKGGGKLRGLTTGLADLDSCLGGLHAGDLVVVGARPAVGKTAFMLNLCTAPAAPVGIISSEQGRAQVGARLLAINGRISLHSMRTGAISTSDIDRATNAAVKLTSGAEIRINDKPGISIDEIVRQARSWKFDHKIKAIYIDYIQRIHPRDKKIPRHEQVADIVQSLKELARELDICVVALGQVSREVDKRADKRPSMGDLAESGCIEREADQIMLLYRDEVYNEASDRRGIMDISVGKNRHGPTGVISAAWIGEFVKVANLGERYDF
jgi:replicative DNA helicase